MLATSCPSNLIVNFYLIIENKPKIFILVVEIYSICNWKFQLIEKEFSNVFRLFQIYDESYGSHMVEKLMIPKFEKLIIKNFE